MRNSLRSATARAKAIFYKENMPSISMKKQKEKPDYK